MQISRVKPGTQSKGECGRGGSGGMEGWREGRREGGM